MASDPYELANLVALDAFGEVRDRLRARLIERMVGVGEEAPTIEVAASETSGQRAASIEEVRDRYLSVDRT